jgi:hypothetical protein
LQQDVRICLETQTVSLPVGTKSDPVEDERQEAPEVDEAKQRRQRMILPLKPAICRSADGRKSEPELPNAELAQLCARLQACELASMNGVSFELASRRLWLRFRGDAIGNWRWSAPYLIYEDSDNALQLVTALDQAVQLSIGEYADYVSPQD